MNLFLSGADKFYSAWIYWSKPCLNLENIYQNRQEISRNSVRISVRLRIVCTSHEYLQLSNRDNPSNGKVNFMKNIRTNIYHCSNPQENPLPAWITAPKKPKVQDIETMEQEKIRKFKECPDSFFPSFCPRSKPGKFRPWYGFPEIYSDSARLSWKEVRVQSTHLKVLNIGISGKITTHDANYIQD